MKIFTRVTDSEGIKSESFGIDNTERQKSDRRKFDHENFLNLAKGSQKSSKTDDLGLIDIESLFDEDTDDRPVLSQEEAWELFA